MMEPATDRMNSILLPHWPLSSIFSSDGALAWRVPLERLLAASPWRDKREEKGEKRWGENDGPWMSPSRFPMPFTTGEDALFWAMCQKQRTFLSSIYKLFINDLSVEEKSQRKTLQEIGLHDIKVHSNYFASAVSGVKRAALIKCAFFFLICSFFFFQLTFHRSVTCRVLSQDQVCLMRFSLSALKVLVFNMTAARGRRFTMLNLVQPPRPYPLRLTTHWEGGRYAVPSGGAEGVLQNIKSFNNAWKSLRDVTRWTIFLKTNQNKKNYTNMVCFLIGICSVLKGDRHHCRTKNEQVCITKTLNCARCLYTRKPGNSGIDTLIYVLHVWYGDKKGQVTHFAFSNKRLGGILESNKVRWQCPGLVLCNLLLPIMVHSLDEAEFPTTTSITPSPLPPPAMATFAALSAKQESEVMYKSSRGQFTPDLTWQSWRVDSTGAHQHSTTTNPLQLPYHVPVLETAPMFTECISLRIIMFTNLLTSPEAGCPACNLSEECRLNMESASVLPSCPLIGLNELRRKCEA